MLIDSSGKHKPLWDLAGSVATPVSRQLSRLMREETGTSAEFDSITYVSEVLLKYETTVCLGILEQSDRLDAAALGFQIVSSDGLGVWADVLPKILNAITTSAKRDYLSYTRAFTQKFATDSKSQQRTLESARGVWSELEEADFTFSRNRLGLLQFFVALRNRTRGHGATTQSQFETINAQLLQVLSFLIESSPILSEDLYRPMKLKEHGEYACRVLRGYPTQEQALQPSALITRSDGLFYKGGEALIELPDFMRYAREDDGCSFLNGKRRLSDDQSPFLDYVTNAKVLSPVSSYLEKPQERPPSVTAGASKFDWTDTVVNNLPFVDFLTYIPRTKLELELREYLLGSAVNFVSLEGSGGAGKTTLAMRVARQIVNGSNDQLSSFDCVIWFSARDVDLDERAGPLTRRRQVTSLESCASLVCNLMREMEPCAADGPEVDQFAKILASGGYKFLLIFDNFESFDDTGALQQFIKRNLAHPSKALMTSREDSFHGDVPVEVGGLLRAEASDLIRKTARQAGCEPRISEAVITRIHEATLGNPYAIKLVVNEFARSAGLDDVFSRAFGEDYLSALFRRSFERLDDAPAYLFLLIGLSPLGRSEMFARLCAIGRQMDYEIARRALLDSHLLDPPDDSDSDSVYRVSWAAEEFCRRILVGHRMERQVNQDCDFLKRIAGAGLARAELPFIYDFIVADARLASCDMREAERDRRIAEWIRGHDPASVKKYAIELGRSSSAEAELVRSAYKRAVELNTTDIDLWLSWAEFEKSHDGHQRALDLVLRAVDFTDSEEPLVRAARITLGIMSSTGFKESMSFSRRRFYTTAFTSRLEAIRHDLHATSLGTLAWLYLQTNDTKQAREALNDGLAKDSNSRDLQNLRERLEKPSYSKVARIKK